MTRLPRLLTEGWRLPISIFLVAVGLGLTVDSFSLVCFFTPLQILIHLWKLKAIEEPGLIKRLGEEYLKYRRAGGTAEDDEARNRRLVARPGFEPMRGIRKTAWPLRG